MALDHSLDDEEQTPSPTSTSEDDMAESGTSSTARYPDPYIVEPTAPHTHTAILVHGLGSNGLDFGSMFLLGSVLSNDKDSPFSRPLNAIYPSMRWVFPSASLRRSTRFNRMKLFSWFDVYSVQAPHIREETQVKGLVQSTAYLRSIIEGEVQKLNEAWGGGSGAEKRVVFGGISQGCAISLATLMSLEHDLGGWMGMSGWMPMRRTFEEALAPENELEGVEVLLVNEDAQQKIPSASESGASSTNPTMKALDAFRQNVLTLPTLDQHDRPEVLSTPVFYGHGNIDEQVPCKLGNKLVDTLKRLNMNVEHQVYEGLDHWYKAPEEIDDMISVFKRNGAWPDPVNTY